MWVRNAVRTAFVETSRRETSPLGRDREDAHAQHPREAQCSGPHACGDDRLTASRLLMIMLVRTPYQAVHVGAWALESMIFATELPLPLDYPCQFVRKEVLLIAREPGSAHDLIHIEDTRRPLSRCSHCRNATWITRRRSRAIDEGEGNGSSNGRGHRCCLAQADASAGDLLEHREDLLCRNVPAELGGALAAGSD